MEKEILEKASYCLSCPLPRCETACPTKNHIRDFIAAVKKQDMAEAAKVLYHTNPFPEFTSLLCDHGRQCQGACIRGLKGEPVSIPQIEKAISEAYPRPYLAGKPNGKKAALIGAGIANLSCAFFLLQKGWKVDIYEKESSIGGAIRTGIPGFRFDKTPLKKVYEDLVALGAVFHFNSEIKELAPLVSSYDAVVLSLGASKENFAGITPENGCMGALDFLKDYNEGRLKEEPHQAIVWGGGNVAMDAARTAKRIYGNTTVLYRRGREQMPANPCEIEEVEKEGVAFRLLENIVAPVYENGNLVGANAVNMELGEPDASGRASFHVIEGSEHFISCDRLIFAIGEKPDPSPFPNLTLGERWATSLPKVYVCGDFRYGAANIAKAITDGRELALYLSNNEE